MSATLSTKLFLLLAGLVAPPSRVAVVPLGTPASVVVAAVQAVAGEERAAGQTVLTATALWERVPTAAAPPGDLRGPTRLLAAARQQEATFQSAAATRLRQQLARRCADTAVPTVRLWALCAAALHDDVVARLGAGDRAGAQRAAWQAATLFAETVPDPWRTPPDAQALLATARRQRAGMARVPLHVVGVGQLWLDGLPPRPIAGTAVLDLPVGAHRLWLVAPGEPAAGQYLALSLPAAGAHVAFGASVLPRHDRGIATALACDTVGDPACDDALRQLGHAAQVDRIVGVMLDPAADGSLMLRDMRVTAGTARTLRVEAPAPHRLVTLAPFRALDGAPTWPGHVLADLLEGRLLRAVAWAPAALAIRGWRDRPVDDPPTTATAITATAITGTYRLAAGALRLDWRIGQGAAARQGTCSVPLAGLDDASRLLTQAIGDALGLALPDTAVAPAAVWPATALAAFGEALQRLTPQPLDPGAAPGLGAPELATVHRLLVQATDGAPTLGRAWSHQGWCSAMLGDFSRAQHELLTALGTAPDLEPALGLSLAYFYARQDNLADTLETLNALVREHPAFVAGHEALVAAYRRAGAGLEAFSAMRQAPVWRED